MNRRTFLRSALAAGGLGIVVFGENRIARAQDDGIVILLNARNPTSDLANAQVRKLFLGQTAFWHGVVPVKVLVRPDASQAAKAFYEPVLGMSPQAFRKHWDKLQLAGRGVAPQSIGGAAELGRAIAAVPGGIGFALRSEVWSVSGVRAVPVR